MYYRNCSIKCEGGSINAYGSMGPFECTGRHLCGCEQRGKGNLTNTYRKSWFKSISLNNQF